MVEQERAGASFENSDVVRNYIHRPPYPNAVYDKLLAIAPRRNCLLDIGCGPGKISRPLSRHFERVLAVDPSPEMIALGRSLDDGQAENIQWIEGLAENVEIGSGDIDLIAAAASIHWMDHGRLFPRLRAQAAPDHRIAVISGDTPFEPPWEADWHVFLGKWIPAATGVAFDQSGFDDKMSNYRPYLDVEGSEHFVSAPFRQTVEEFIGCQHSRDTFAPFRLGDRMAAFDGELREVLAPHAVDGWLSFVVRTKMVWGAIRA